MSLTFAIQTKAVEIQSLNNKVEHIIELCRGGEQLKARHDMLVRQTHDRLLKLKVRFVW